MRKHNHIHTLGALHYKAHFQFLSKLKGFKCALWSEKYVTKVQTMQYLSMLALVSQCHEVHLDLKKVLLMSSTVPITLQQAAADESYFLFQFLFWRISGSLEGP